MAYQPIEDYGVIGNMRTVALVGMDGSIDWFCFPHFDSPSVFAALLDDKKGGRFKIAPGTERVTRKQVYWPDTNVLVTRFLASEGVGEITDFMPVGEAAEESDRDSLVRRVTAVRGSLAFRMECRPAFNYARHEHRMQITGNGVCFHAPQLSLGLATRVPLKQDGNGAVAEFTLHEEETAIFVLRPIPGRA